MSPTAPSSLLGESCGFISSAHTSTGLERRQRRRCLLPIASVATVNRREIMLGNPTTAYLQPSLFSSTQLSLTSLPAISADPATATATTTSFEPVLNVPAFSVFLLIAVLFVWLQSRILAIQEAAEERTMLLDQLRAVKRNELDNKASPEQVQEALDLYEWAYWNVENLRTVIPGVRLVAPPSQSVNRRIMEENELAAQQFLGIEPTSNATESIKQQKPMSRLSIGILALVAVSQIALLALLVFNDPMQPSTSMSSSPLPPSSTSWVETAMDAAANSLE